MNAVNVYTAPYVVAHEHKVIRDGAVVVQSGRIVEVGGRKTVVKTWAPSRVIECNGILLPPLINCHTHLELSHLEGISPPSPESGMSVWIEEVLQHRQQQKISQQDLVQSYRAALQQQHLTGVVLLADIMNSVDVDLPQFCRCTEVCQIVEMIAPTKPRAAETIQYIETLPQTTRFSPHSPYSTSADLITYLKARSRANKQLFSIHLAESSAEYELMEFQTGDFRELLEKRESWDGSLLGYISTAGPVHYLKKLDVLDDKTLCVHCVHLRDEEIAILADSKAKVCVCPGSNSFLSVGTAPLEKILLAGILPGIGTDSIASNECLDIWGEMQKLRSQFPDIPPEKMFAMATQGGAESLGRENDYGTLEKGKKGVFLEAVFDDINTLNETDVFDILTSAGKPEKLNWISPISEI